MGFQPAKLCNKRRAGPIGLGLLSFRSAHDLERKVPVATPAERKRQRPGRRQWSRSSTTEGCNRKPPGGHIHARSWSEPRAILHRQGPWMALKLKFACGEYDRTAPFRTGDVRPKDIDLEYTP